MSFIILVKELFCLEYNPNSLSSPMEWPYSVKVIFARDLHLKSISMTMASQMDSLQKKKNQLLLALGQ